MRSALLFLIGACTVYASQQSDGDTCETLYLLNLFPHPDNRTFAGWDKGFELLPAGHLATKHINSNPDILPGYKLEVIDVPSEACGIHLIVDGITEYITHLFSINPMCVFGVVGLYCSTVTNSIAPIANHPSLGYVQIAASTSPLHRNTKSFPHTFHTIASSRIFNKVMVALMNQFGWNKVNVVYGAVGFYFRSTAVDFFSLIEKNRSLSVTQIPVDHTIQELFQLISEEEGRIGYFTVTNEETADILCEAYRKDFLSRYQFIFHERTISEVLSAQVDCTEEELKEAMGSIFLLQYNLESPNNTTLVSGKTYAEYRSEYFEALSRYGEEVDMPLENNNYANALYDQVWAFALAANKSLNNASFFNTSIRAANSMNQAVRNRDSFTRSLMDVEFNGASGFIKFGIKQEVQTSVNIYRVIDGKQQLIGEYNAYSGVLKFKKHFDTNAVPGDSFDTRYALLPPWLGSLVILCCAILILLTLFNTIAMLVLRRKPEIKSTSLYLSSVILIGCFLLLFSPVLLTIKSMFPITNAVAYLTLCSLEFWFFIDGMIIIFLTLLLRLLRVFYVFRSHHSTSKYWSDKYLILYIILMFSTMLIMLVLQSAVDPFHLKSSSTFVTSDTTKLPYKLVYYYCSSTSTWLVLSSIFVVVVMILLVFLAIQTRHIKKRHFKDTKKVNMFIFSVCITYSIFIPVWLILVPVSSNGAYACQCIANLMAATFCQVFLFLPKVIPAIYPGYTARTHSQTQLATLFNH